MKINKKRLKRIIREERAKLLKEGLIGHVSIGFAGYTPNHRPDFAKAYGKDAKVIGQFRNNNTDLREQPMPAPSSDPMESAYQELKFSGAYKDLQTSMHDSLIEFEALFEKHSDMMLQADQGSLLDDLQEVMDKVDNLRATFNALR